MRLRDQLLSEKSRSRTYRAVKTPKNFRSKDWYGVLMQCELLDLFEASIVGR